MTRFPIKILSAALLLICGAMGMWYLQNPNARQIAQLEEKNRVLTQVVERLSDEKRVAEVVVTDQQMIDNQLHTTLLFVETDKSGNSLPPRRFMVIGEMAHIDALVIKFEREFIAQGDGLRGHSIALFTRIYGDQQSPAQGTSVDPPNEIPAIYRGADPKVSDFELSLWRDFWKLAEDTEYAAKYGVRVANGQGVWGPFEPDKLYTITLESSGGLNITPEPLKPVFKELIRSRTATTR